MLDNSRVYSLRSLIVITIFMGLLLIAVNGGIYLILNQLALSMTPESNMKFIISGMETEIIIQNIPDIIKYINIVLDNFFVWIVPATSIFFFISAIFLWLIMKISIYSIFSSETYTAKSKYVKSDSSTISPSTQIIEQAEKKDHADQRIEQERERRIFLHFISVLQREGRILDFFSEDLTFYDDEQIGAAVRSIQEDCKKTVTKYLLPQPVLSKEEGDVVEIPIGFDPDSIKLTGNVSGEPPFKGILRHRGWKVGKRDVPRLSDVLDSSIIAPAEVEIE